MKRTDLTQSQGFFLSEYLSAFIKHKLELALQCLGSQPDISQPFNHEFLFWSEHLNLSKQRGFPPDFNMKSLHL